MSVNRLTHQEANKLRAPMQMQEIAAAAGGPSGGCQTTAHFFLCGSEEKTNPVRSRGDKENKEGKLTFGGRRVRRQFPLDPGEAKRNKRKGGAAQVSK